MYASQWDKRVENCRKILIESMKVEWLLPEDQLPPADQLNVSTFIEGCGMLTPGELEITESSGTSLVDQMAAGSLTAVETTTAFLKRAHIAQQLVNFATEFLITDALATAAKLDEFYASTGKIIGPLHGLPISLKEHIGLEGRIAHTGYVAWTDNIAPEDALMVRLLRNAGAVLHVRTNLPQSAMHTDCSNNITGTTVNPHNRQLTSGGSSGGEGAALGLRCSVIGVGTDIGGSVRNPAAFCGSFGLRTTALRNPYKGVILPGGGQESIRCVISPLANCAADLELFQRAILDQEPWEEETQLIPMPWKRIQPYKPTDITIGVIWDDGVVHPHPPITRGLKYAVSKLKKAGVNVVDFEPYNHQEAWDIITTLWFPDGAQHSKRLLEKSGESAAILTEWVYGLAKPNPISVEENWELNVRREELRENYHRLMKERGVDFILCPAYTGVAAALGTAQYFNYCAVWNILDQPCISFPTKLKVDPTIDVVEKYYKPRSDTDRREYNKYSPEIFSDAPIALQLVGKHFRDEETVAATDLVAKIVQD